MGWYSDEARKAIARDEHEVRVAGHTLAARRIVEHLDERSDEFGSLGLTQLLGLLDHLRVRLTLVDIGDVPSDAYMAARVNRDLRTAV